MLTIWIRPFGPDDIELYDMELIVALKKNIIASIRIAPLFEVLLICYECKFNRQQLVARFYKDSETMSDFMIVHIQHV